MMKKVAILCGTTKAGSTSLYEYLVDHPNVKVPIIKELAYFMDTDLKKAIGTDIPYHHESHPNSFYEYFSDTKEQTECLYLDATPHYMYSKGAAQRIKDYFGPNTSLHIIFILRNPTQRVISWYYYGKQQGFIKDSMNFENFLEQNVKEFVQNQAIHPSFTAIATGKYVAFIEPYYKIFEKEQISILFIDDLKTDTTKFIKGVAQKLGLNPNFYDAYNFTNHNKTEKTRNQLLNQFYITIRGFILNNFNSVIRDFFIRIGRKYVSPLYKKVNRTKLEKEIINKATLASLNKYYQQSNEDLAALVGEKLPWYSSPKNLDKHLK